MFDNVCKRLREYFAFISSFETAVTAPVKLSFGLLKIPVTTTSSTVCKSSSNTIARDLLSFFTGTSCRLYPTKEKINIKLSRLGKSISNSPFTLVTNPKVVPFTRIVTPGSNSPFLSFTIPFTVNLESVSTLATTTC